MKFLLDQDVYHITARFIRKKGHDVVLVSEIGLSNATDTVILNEAIKRQRIMVTRDRDFGRLVFVNSLYHGVIYLRMLPSNIETVHQADVMAKPLC